MRKTCLLCALLLAACASAAEQPIDVSPQPYLTSTSVPTFTPDVLFIVETPVTTSTPFIYIIEKGDTLSQIAEKFKISQDALRAANPDLKTNILSIGQTILIPDPASPLAAASTPTPVPAPVTQTVCHPTADSGNWCFALIQNSTDGVLENVSAQITLLDENHNAIASQTAFTPLDIIAPNSSLPVYVYFPNSPANVKPQVQLLSALQSNTSRHLPASLTHTIAQIAWDGKTAQLSGQIHLPAESTAATQVWVAAVAYDTNGTVVGVKRWEAGALQPGTITNFQFGMASLGSAIEAVKFFVQAMP
ncbi:MAG: LysM domain-containing protein [Anaerolineales bacterium]|nr:MAG: LysM domain-containing protein [Anaerolineales bacterium]